MLARASAAVARPRECATQWPPLSTPVALNAGARALARPERGSGVGEASLAEEDGQPHRGGVGFGPLYPVLASRGQQQTVSGSERHDLPVRVGQPRSALQQNHPLVFVLLVPGPFRRALTGRYLSLIHISR